MTAPRVTVGLPVFNGERYLRETIDSILAQDHADLELLVADNASTDGTLDLLEEYRRQDPRVRILPSDRNRGAAWNYNRLVDEARGELFKWSGYDDLLSSDYLTECIAALDADGGAVLAYPETVIIDAHGNVASTYRDRLQVTQSSATARVVGLARRIGLCNACFGVMRRDSALSTGLIRPHISSDVTFLAEMAARGRFVRVPSAKFFRRVHATSSRQGHVTMRDVARWFDPDRQSTPRVPRLRLAASTAAALYGSPLPAWERLSTSVSFTAVYAARRAHIEGSRLKSRLVREEPRPAEMIHSLEASK